MSLESEAWIAIAGVVRPGITERGFTRHDGYVGRMLSRVQSWVMGSSKYLEINRARNHGDLLKKLNGPFEFPGVEAISSPEVVAEIVPTIRSAREILVGLYPHAPDSGVMQPADIPPSFEASELWSGVVESVDDPAWVIGMLEAGALTLGESKAMREIYPELHQEIAVELMKSATLRAARGKPVGPWKESSIKVFLGVPSTSPFPDLSAVEPPSKPRVGASRLKPFKTEELKAPSEKTG